MAQPILGQTHIDVPLTNISTAYIQNQDNFVASKIFPVVPVEKLSNKYYTFGKNAWFRDEAQMRADATESAGGGFDLSTDNYSCDVWAFHKDIGDNIRYNSDSQIDIDRASTEFVTQRLLLKAEKQFVSTFFTTSVWGTDVVGGSDFTVWSNLSSATPNEDVETGKETILKNTGFKPNTLVLGYQVYRKLKNHPAIQNQIKYVQAVTGKTITTDLLAQYFDVERVIVAQSINATNNEGGTAAYNFVFGKHALLLYVPPNPGLMTPSAGYTFSWTGVSGGLGSTVGVKKFRMENLAATRVEAEIAFGMKVVATDLGYFFSGAVA